MTRQHDQFEQGPQLTADDQRLLEELVEAGYDPSRIDRDCTAEERERLERLASLLRTLEEYPVEDASEGADDALVNATLARINRAEIEQESQYSIQHHMTDPDVREPRRRVLRFPDLISVACVLLIAGAMFWPLLGNLQQHSSELSCANNLRHMGYAFSSYSADHGGAVPMSHAGISSSWDTISNAVNLVPLVEGGYCREGHLNCTGEHTEDAQQFTYSYQFHIHDPRLIWGGTPRQFVVLGDRNPIIDALRSGRSIGPGTGSRSHGERGQNILLSDGTVVWLESPVIGGSDNIWLPSDREELIFGAPPTELGDAFLAH